MQFGDSWGNHEYMVKLRLKQPLFRPYSGLLSRHASISTLILLAASGAKTIEITVIVVTVRKF
jgi:hypothetical protein